MAIGKRETVWPLTTTLPPGAAMEWTVPDTVTGVEPGEKVWSPITTGVVNVTGGFAMGEDGEGVASGSRDTV